MKKIKWISILLSIGIVLGSCAGDDGEPGPVGDAGTAGNNGATGVAGALGQGLEKVGYFQGTVSGKRTDGTAFSEVFKFEYGRTNADAFRDDSGSKWLDLFRYNKVYYYNSGIEVYGLKLSGTSLVADPTQTQVYFDFAKELSTTDLFRLSATPYFKDSKGYIISLSSEQNKLYNFNASNMNIGYTETQYETANGIVPVYLFYVYGQAASYLVYYRKDDGTVLIIKDQSNGNPITSGAVFDKYNKLLFKNNATVNALTFFDKATGTSLHTVIPDIAADQLTITNYNHDATSGVLTFDYTLKVSGYRGIVHGANTSGNDLIITGSFNSGGKIYKNNSGRTGG